MDRVWEIIEHRKKEPIEESYRMGRKSMRFATGKKSYSEEYSKGVKDGFCAAIAMLDDALEEMDK